MLLFERGVLLQAIISEHRWQQLFQHQSMASKVALGGATHTARQGRLYGEAPVGGFMEQAGSGACFSTHILQTRT